VGSARYRGCCRHPFANGNAESHANGYGYTYGMRPGNCNTYANGNRYGDGYCYGDAHWYRDAQTNAYAEKCANSEASSHPPAKTIVVFAEADIAVSATSGK
jgi:hypothetical protein